MSKHRDNLYTAMENTRSELEDMEGHLVKSEIAPEYKINEKDICTQALDKWEDKQIIMVFEEMAELQKELSKAMRGQANIIAIAEEISDVEIMLAQMKIYFGIADAVSRYKTYKLKRLDEKIKEQLGE